MYRSRTTPRRSHTRSGLALLLSAAALLLSLFAFAGSAQATGIVDQQQPVSTWGLVVLYGTHGTNGLAQTFTAGHTGPLNEVSVYVENSHTADFDLRAQICTVSGGMPTLTPLASAQVPVPDAFDKGWFSIPFASPATVTAGTQYALKLWAVSDYQGSSFLAVWMAGSPDSYAEGTAYFQSSLDWWWVASGMDFAFKTFYPDTTPPVVTPPADITANPTSSTGGPVGFAATATDNLDGTVPAGSIHYYTGYDTAGEAEVHSGDTFPIGATTVTVAATDSSGNTGTASFTVTVRECVEVLDQAQEGNIPGLTYPPGNPSSFYAQSFSPGHTGPLTKVSLFIANQHTGSYSAQAMICTWPVSGPPTDGQILATASADFSSPDSDGYWQDFTFASPPTVTAGTQYAIVVSGANFSWYMNEGSSYLPGWQYVWTGSTWFTRGDRGNDFEFRTYSLVNLSTPTDIALDSNSVDENMLAGTTVGGFSTTDADSGDSFSYSLVSGVGSDENAAFSLDDDGVLKTAASFDHEAKSFYRIRVRATDAGGLTCEKVFQIDIRNVNEPPSDITMHKDWVDENQPEGAHVGWFETIDPDNGESFACSLVSGDGDTDNALFTLEEYGDLYTAAVFNYETKDSYSIRVRSTEADGFSVEKAFTITVNDVNDPPVLAAIGNKSGPFGDTITFTASATDEDGDAITYSLVGSPVGSLDPTSGAYTWTPGPTAIGAHSFVVIASDGHVADAESITITATTRTATITACDVQSAVLNSPVKLSGLLSDSGGLTSLLANAKLTVKLTPIAGGTTITLPDISVDAGGKFSATFATPTPIPLGSYEVCLVIGDRYIGTASWYDALAVYNPAAGFASGGGWFLWPGTTQKTTFGFVTNYMKNRSNFKGNLVMVRHLPDGTIYRVKSNAVIGLSLSSPTKVGGWVSFNGKANYMDPTMCSWLGGYTFNMYAEDNNQPGSGPDKFWIQIISNGTIVGACSMPGATAGGAVPAVPLGGGNIVVPHK